IGIPTILLCFSIAFVSTKRNALNGRPDMFEGDIDDMTRKHQTPNTRGDHDSFEDFFDAQGDESENEEYDFQDAPPRSRWGGGPQISWRR
ncbi:unnamed protein product, partial [Porites evermanni]